MENFILTEPDPILSTPIGSSFICNEDKLLINNHLSHIKLTDFGLSKYSDEFLSPTLAGSLPYIAPEVLNEEKFNETCDNWSLGVLTFILLMNDFPFKGEFVMNLFKI